MQVYEDNFMALTKVDLAENLFQVLGFNRQEAKKLIELFFEEIQSLLEQGHSVHLSGFGNFNLRDKRERPGRNPRTGKNVTITARRVVTFRAGQKLKFRVKQYAGIKPEVGSFSTQA